MKNIASKHSFLELFSRPTAHTFGESWDSIAVGRIIREHPEANKSPAFLFLGRKEAELLRAHLGEAYSEESVPTLNQIYYMGLKVVTLDLESYICTGGSKGIRRVQAHGFRIAS